MNENPYGIKPSAPETHKAPTQKKAKGYPDRSPCSIWHIPEHLEVAVRRAAAAKDAYEYKFARDRMDRSMICVAGLIPTARELTTEQKEQDRRTRDLYDLSAEMAEKHGLPWPPPIAKRKIDAKDSTPGGFKRKNWSASDFE